MTPGRIRIGAIATAVLVLIALAVLPQTRADCNVQQKNAQQPSGSKQQSSIANTMSSGGMQREAEANQDATKSAINAMSGSMHMDPHMFMTPLRPKQPGDDERAARIVETVRAAMEKYRDYHVALADRYRIFAPNLPQRIYHFTNYWNAMKAGFTFDPSKPCLAAL